MARRLILTFAVLLVAGGALWLAQNQNGKGSPEPSVPTSADLGSAHSETVSHAPVDQARMRWAPIAAGVRRLDPSDHAGLDELDEQAKAAIRADEAAWLEFVSRSMALIIAASFEESFFTVSSWIRSSHAPAKILDAIWQYQPPMDTQVADSEQQAHHQAMTLSVRYERVQSFGLRELRQQVSQGSVALDSSESLRLTQALLPRATRERSLDLAIELFQLLAVLGAPEPAIQAALQGHSERDRQLLQSVLSGR